MGQRHALPIFFLFKVDATVSRRAGLTLSTCVLLMALITLLVPSPRVRMRGSCRPQARSRTTDIKIQKAVSCYLSDQSFPGSPTAPECWEPLTRAGHTPGLGREPGPMVARAPAEFSRTQAEGPSRVIPWLRTDAPQHCGFPRPSGEGEAGGRAPRGGRQKHDARGAGC